MPDKAVILLSGGLDSTTTLAIARQAGFECYCLTLDYGQRHRAELEAAANIAKIFGAVTQRVMHLDLAAFGGSALTDHRVELPTTTSGTETGIPITYVPARNTIMLSLALAWSEVLNAHDIFIGANAVDYSGYPDCRPEFIAAFEQLAHLATKAAIEGAPCHIHAPLITLSKAQIIQQGQALGVDYASTVSCYQADAAGRACGQCASCRLRKQGFETAGIPDPTRYF